MLMLHPLEAEEAEIFLNQRKARYANASLAERTVLDVIWKDSSGEWIVPKWTTVEPSQGLRRALLVHGWADIPPINVVSVIK